MTNGNDVRERLHERANPDYPPAWRFEQPGDEVAGSVIAIKTEVTTKGGTCPVVLELAELGTGRPVSVMAWHSVLQRQLAKARPAVGEVVLIRYDGKVTEPVGGGSPYENFTVVVDRPEDGTAVDWERIATQAEKPTAPAEAPAEVGTGPRDEIPY